MDWRHLARLQGGGGVGAKRGRMALHQRRKGSHFNVRTFMPKLPGGPSGSPQEGTLEEGE